MKNLFALMTRLNEAQIHFSLKTVRDDFIMLDVSVPGERWEIEITPEGEVEIEIFKSDGVIHDEKMLDTLFEKFSD